MIGGAQADGIGALGLKIWCCSNLELIARNRKACIIAAAGAANQAISKGIPGIRIQARECCHSRTSCDRFIEATGR